MKEYTSSIPSCNFKVPPCGYNDDEILYFDIETTGFSPREHIFTLSAAHTTATADIVSDSFSLMILPMKKL